MPQAIVAVFEYVEVVACASPSILKKLILNQKIKRLPCMAVDYGKADFKKWEIFSQMHCQLERGVLCPTIIHMNARFGRSGEDVDFIYHARGTRLRFSDCSIFHSFRQNSRNHVVLL